MDEQQSSKEDMLLRILEDPEVVAAGQNEDETAAISTSSQGAPLALPPELLGKLPMLLSAIGPMMGDKGGKGKDSKSALLLALKPYMSPQRCDAIDKLITFNRLSEILRQLR
ncbi:MAG: hypothetical protein IJW70_05195 [Clostridia bacterium]|nr:hypothetical protein [Clostridia bacterium]